MKCLREVKVYDEYTKDRGEGQTRGKHSTPSPYSQGFAKTLVGKPTDSLANEMEFGYCGTTSTDDSL